MRVVVQESPTVVRVTEEDVRVVVGGTGGGGSSDISDATALGTLTEAVADALFLLSSNAAGTAARKVAITTIVRAILQATDAAGVRSAIGAGTGNALTSGTLAQFAATTSAQLASVLSDETGSGAAVFGTSPTIAGPLLTGTAVVRQTGGTAGVDEVQISHDGTRSVIRSNDGQVRIQAPNLGGAADYLGVFDNSGNLFMQIGNGSAGFRDGVSNSQDVNNWLVTLGGRWIVRGGYDFRHPSTTAIDLGLQRAAAGVLGLETSGGTQGYTIRSLPTSPASISTTQNNYSPGTARHLRLTASTPTTITGMVAGVDGEERYLWNVGGSDITLTHNDAGSTAANRFQTSTKASIVLANNGCAFCWYDGATAAWRVVKLG